MAFEADHYFVAGHHVMGRPITWPLKLKTLANSHSEPHLFFSDQGPKTHFCHKFDETNCYLIIPRGRLRESVQGRHLTEISYCWQKYLLEETCNPNPIMGHGVFLILSNCGRMNRQYASKHTHIFVQVEKWDV